MLEQKLTELTAAVNQLIQVMQSGQGGVQHSAQPAAQPAVGAQGVPPTGLAAALAGAAQGATQQAAPAPAPVASANAQAEAEQYRTAIFAEANMLLTRPDGAPKLQALLSQLGVARATEAPVELLPLVLKGIQQAIQSPQEQPAQEQPAQMQAQGVAPAQAGMAPGMQAQFTPPAVGSGVGPTTGSLA